MTVEDPHSEDSHIYQDPVSCCNISLSEFDHIGNKAQRMFLSLGVSVQLPINKHVSTYAPKQRIHEEQDRRRVDDVGYSYFSLYFCVLELKK